MNKIRKTDSDRFYDRIGKLLVEARSSAVQAINLFDGGFGYKFFLGEKTCVISKL